MFSSLPELFVPGIVVARRSGRGIARLLGYLWEGCANGEPVPIVISIVVAAIIVGGIVAKFSGGSGE